MNLNHDVTVFMIIMVWGGISSDIEILLQDALLALVAENCDIKFTIIDE